MISARDKLEEERIMAVRIKSLLRIYVSASQTTSWILLVPGFVLMGKSILENFSFRHVTLNSMSWSSAGLLLLLIGSLLKSFRQKLGPNPSDSSNPMG
jgi:hypothetical protein